MMTGSKGQLSRLLLWCAIFVFAFSAQEVNAQCANDNNFASNGGIPPCGSFNSLSLGAGTFATFTVTTGATYEFRTCGTFVNTGGLFNTRLTGYQGPGAFLFQNDNSGVCANSNDSRVQWTATFSGTLRVLVDRNTCDACVGGPSGTNCPALGSAVLDYRQVDNLFISSSSADMCPGQTRNLTASPGGGSFSGTGVSGATFTAPGTPGSYAINYTLGACIETQNITVLTPSVEPTIITASQTTICPGQSTTLTIQDGTLGSGAVWRWYAGGCGSGGVINTGAAISVSPGSSTTYYARAEGTCNNTACASITITVGTQSVEATSVNASSTFVCSGDAVNLSVVGGSLGTNADWEWYIGGCGSGASIASGASATVNPTSPTTYYVRAEGGCNTTGCKSVFIDIKTPSTAPTGISRSNNNFCPGGSSTLSVVGGSLGTGANWVWYQDICCVAPIGTGSIINVNPTGTTEYFVRAEGDCNNTSAATTTVTVLVESVIPTQIIASQNPLCSGQNTILTLDGGSLGTGASWRWYSGSCGGTFINTGNSITVNPTSNTTYFVRAEGTCNNTLCQQITITVSQGISLSSITSTPVSCNGGNNGTATVNITGGITPYTYTWSSGASTQTALNLTAGSYTVTVSDAANCSVTGSISVTQPSALSINAVTGTFVVVCNGDSTGSITASVSGGTAPYLYSLNGGAQQSSNTFNNLPAGNYNLAVEDANNCSLSYSSNPIVITELPLLVLTIDSSRDVTCSGANDGAIFASAGGGTPPYVYSVNGSPFQPGPLGTFNNLSSGTYTVLVQDANGCQDTSNVSLINSTSISIFPTSVTDVSCFGLTDGSFTVGVTNGTNPLDFTINGISFQNSPTFSGLPANTYTVQVVDAAGCTEDTTVTVAQPSEIVITDDSITNVGCNGATTGAIFISVAGGTPGYTYAWSSGASTQDVTGLAAGSYTVTVTDNNGCTATESFTVTQAPALILSLANIDSVRCNGQSNGKIDITVIGGTPGYSYAWSNGKTSEDNANIPAGTYTVTVTDANGCTVSNSYTVSQPTTLMASTTKTDILCNGDATGAVDLTVSGGTTPYNYLWSNGAITEDISGLTAGTYTVVISDANGCTANVSTMVTQPNAISISGTVTDITCFGDTDGAIDVTVQGGTTPYTYAWSTGPTTEDLTSLAPGTYTITVTDGNGCTASQTFTVPNASQLVLNLAGSGNVSCNGGTNGFINISVTGGVNPYTYAWSSGPTSQDLNNITAGNYDVTVTDNNGCTITDSYTITEPTAISLSLSATPADCNNSNTGSVDLTVSGGVTPYTYLWSNFATTEDLAAVTAGKYTVVVTDANGCEEIDSVNVTDPNAIAVAAAVTNPSCFGVPDGAIDITATGGTSPYTYAWSTGASSEDLTGLATGSYTVTVTDANGCDFQTSFVLTQPAEILLTSSVADGTCDGSVLGSIDLTVNGGTSPFNYTWSNGGTTQDINNLAIGSYTVTVTDANGCIATHTTSVNALDGPQLFGAINHVSCNGGNDGEILLTVLGGNPPFTYSWSNGQTTEDIVGLVASSYSVTVTGSTGCLAVKTFNVTQPNALNLTASSTDADCANGIFGSIDLSVGGGTTPYTYQWTNGLTTQDLTGLISGIYTVIVTDANGCTASLSRTINDPSGLTVNGVVSNASCNGFADGSVDVTVTGGASPYTYAWSNGAVTEDVSGLSAGVISITVTDNTGCGAFGGYTINEPASLAASFTTTDASCSGSVLGSINMTPSGGTPPYTFAWSNGPTSEDQTGLLAGTYDVTITDINGCTATFSASVTAFDGPQIASTVVNVDCNGGNDGAVFLTVTGTNAPFTYNWSNGTAFPDLTGVPAGTYNVTVTNSIGCDGFATFVITQPTAISAFANVTDADCANGITGAIDMTPSGGTAPYTYLWATGQTTQDLTGLVAGNYTVVITDANGCDFTVSFTVNDPSGLAISGAITNATCNGDTDGAIDITATGGSTPYTYAWSHGPTTEDVTGLAAGNYTVTVTDNVGCDLIGAFVVAEPAALALSFNTVDAACNGSTQGSVDLAVTGGTAPYTYVWSNGPTTQDISGLTAGTYTVTVTDANACTAVGSANISNLNGPSVSAQVTNVSCNGSIDGEVDLSVSGTLPPFTYAWSNGSTFQDLTGVGAGTYTVTVTNDSGCVNIQTYTITEPSAINLSATTVNADCANGITGSIDMTVSGGTAPYTYLWATGQTTQDITGLIAGNYTVVVTDANGCEEIGMFTITDPSGLTASGVVTDILCFGNTTGAIDVTASGGTGPYTFLWGHGPTTEDVSGLSAGPYAVTVTDAVACQALASFIVDEPDSISLDANLTNLTCSGNNDGGIDLLVVGGTAPYTYAWSTGPTTQDLTNLPAGTYTVTVTDANSCTATLSASVIQPGVLNVLGTVVDVACQGDMTGAIFLTVNGGTPTFLYSWSNGANTQVITSLAAGAYTVTVLDQGGCSDTATFTVSEPATALSLSVTGTDADCANGITGTVDLTVTGGTTPYSFAWDNGANTEDLTGLSAGVYTVIVSDANGCSATISYTVNDPNAPNVTGVVTDATCNGGADGAIDITVTGGAPPYTYSWTSGDVTEDLTGLMAGTYGVTVTDNLGCQFFIGFIVNDPAGMMTTTVAVDANCSGTITGSIDLTVAGGASPYTYNWSTGAITQDISGLLAGTYTVTITDANGCTTTASDNVSQTDTLDVIAAVENVGCNGDSTGAIFLTPFSGVPPYAYAWATGETTSDILNLSVGSYTVTVSDNAGCQKIRTIAVNEPSPLNYTTIKKDVACHGDADGIVNLSVFGGTAPYSYLWSNFDTSQDLNGVVANRYTFIATDDNFCTVTGSVTITQPAELELADSAVNVSCNGAADGGIFLTPSGGTPPYTYLWNTGDTSQNLTGLSGGAFSVTITDDSLCTINASYTIIEPAILAGTTDSTDVTCPGGSDGAINLTVSGGTTPYNYAWSTGDTTQDISGVNAGIYGVTVTDASGCTITIATTVNQPAPIAANAVVSNISCFGLSDGAVDITVTGGTSPYTYFWSNGDTTEDITGLSAGAYLVTITDANGCVEVEAFSVTQPTALAASTTSTDVSCNGFTDGTVDLTVSGGTTPYSYLWSNTDTTEDLAAVGAGTYTVTVTDANGCTITASATVTEPLPITVVGSVTNALCYGSTDGTIDITVTGGSSPYTYVWSNAAVTQDIIGLAAGPYVVTITDANNCVLLDTFTVNEPDSLSLSAVVNDVSCNGGADGSINLTVIGGTIPYSYMWTSNDITQDLVNVAAGSYTVTVTDRNNCQDSATYVVNEPPALTVTEVVTNVSCNGGSDGAIDITPGGGTPPYTYSWSNGDTTQDLSGLMAGTYTVQIRDANNCTLSGSYTVTQPQLLVTSGAVTNVSCNGGSDGSVDLTVTGGTTPYSFVWSNGDTTEDLTGVVAGTYDVTVTDANGCADTSSYTISEPPALVLTGQVTDVTCFGGNNGTVNLTVTGGTQPYIYLWSNGATNQDLNNVSAGTYTVTVTDANGCIDSATYTVNEPPDLVVSLTGQNISCNGGSNGAVNATVSGGTTPYSYAWSNGDTTQNISNLPAGMYSLTVTDGNNCVEIQTVTLVEPPLLNGFGAVTDASCAGASDGAIDITPVGGTPPYTYQWSNTDTTQDVSGLLAGPYTVTITDDSACTRVLIFNVNQPDSLMVEDSLFHNKCYGDIGGAIDITVTGGTPPYSYLWSTGAASQDVFGLVAGVYSLTLTDANNCSVVLDSAYTITQPDSIITSLTQTSASCSGFEDGFIDLTVTGGSPPYSYFWSTFNFTEDLDSVKAGRYVVIVSDTNGCQKIDSIFVLQPDPLVLDVISKGAGCGIQAGGLIDVTPTGGTPPYTYEWSSGDTTQDLSGLTAGTYEITVTDSNGCFETAEIIVPSFPVPEADFAAQTCNGLSVGFFNNSTISQGTMDFVWDFGDGDSTTDVNPVHVYAVADTYTVTLFVTSDRGCEDQITMDVIVRADPAALISVDGNTSDPCAADSANLSVAAGAGSYLWSNGATTNTITAYVTGNYSVTVVDTFGCVSEGDVDLVLFGANDVQVSNDTSISLGFEVPLYALGGATVEWVPGTYLDDSTSATPTAQPLENITYIVTITDFNGCFVVDTVNIEVRNDFALVTPNLFTPNGDGYNDTWDIQNIIFYQGCEVIVFNRWGSEVYRSEEYQNDWDGTQDGKELPDGTYYYIINCDGAPSVSKGAVTILR